MVYCPYSFHFKVNGGLKTDELVLQEFQGVVTLEGDKELVSDANKVPLRTREVLSSCHALVFVDNKLVSCVEQADNLALTLSSCHALLFVDNKLVSCVEQADNLALTWTCEA
jgi:hypothetical protein